MVYIGVQYYNVRLRNSLVYFTAKCYKKKTKHCSESYAIFQTFNKTQKLNNHRNISNVVKTHSVVYCEREIFSDLSQYYDKHCLDIVSLSLQQKRLFTW